MDPLKLVAVGIAGKGHWIAGTTMVVTCYLLSLVLLERLFVIVKPKLLTIPWFAKAIPCVRTQVAASFRRLREGTSVAQSQWRSRPSWLNVAPICQPSILPGSMTSVISTSANWRLHQSSASSPVRAWTT